MRHPSLRIRLFHRELAAPATEPEKKPRLEASRAVIQAEQRFKKRWRRGR